MLQIICPHCGARAESEFAYGGEAGIVRPLHSEALDDAQWADYLFMRRNPKGLHHEQWRHASGCGQWFQALRDTVSCRIHATWKIGDPMPELPAGSAGGQTTAGAPELAP
jgi:sarcosine oxidase subunit delta